LGGLDKTDASAVHLSLCRDQKLLSFYCLKKKKKKLLSFGYNYKNKKEEKHIPWSGDLR
jgi:hypothetical protein